MTLSDGVLRLSAEVDHGLYLAFDRHRPALDDVDCIDARRVTFLACPGLRLLAQVAEARAASLPLWASPAVLRLLHLTGLHTLFDLRS